MDAFVSKNGVCETHGQEFLNGEILAHRGAHTSTFKPILKAIALTISFVFFVEQIDFAQGENRVAPAPANVVYNNRIDLDQVSIPRDVAITKDVNITSSDRLIIDIKDTHDNFGAQESIVAILENLLVNYNINVIGVEGSEGYIDMSVISAFPDEKVKRTVAEGLMKEGRISAGEFFAALSATPVKIYGIDDSKLYLQNYNAFLELLKFKNENLGYVDTLKSALAALEDKIISSDLKLLNHNSVLNGSTNIKFTDRWGAVRGLGEKNGVKIEGYPNIASLEKAIALEKGINYAGTNNERDLLLDVLTQKLPRAKLEELVLKSLSFKLGKLSKSVFYSYIIMLAKSNGIDTSIYPNLEKFSDYVTLYESIDIAGLMDEIEGYECTIKEKLYRNSAERELTTLLKNSEILYNLYSVKLTNGQLRYLLSHQNDIKKTTFIDFIKKHYAENKMAIPADLDGSLQIFDKLPEALVFYSAAMSRNRAMLNNTIAMMKKNNVTAAAIVTGGFHTTGIKNLMSSDKLSYLVLLPRYNPKIDKRPYITILTNNAAGVGEYTENGSYLALFSMFSVMKEIVRSLNVDVKAAMEKAMAAMIADFIRTRMENGANVNATVLKNLVSEYLLNYSERQNDTVSGNDKTADKAAEDLIEFKAMLEKIKPAFEDRIAKGEMGETSSENNLADRIQRSLPKYLAEKILSNTANGKFDEIVERNAAAMGINDPGKIDAAKRIVLAKLEEARAPAATAFGSNAAESNEKTSPASDSAQTEGAKATQTETTKATQVEAAKAAQTEAATPSQTAETAQLSTSEESAQNITEEK
ncbi:MAG TPA: hypothetical protein PKG81_05205, partial [Candidatus Omnitrophota bacterium]|nr:hypothetical protein [Candidatus Omnitrophota bacterium]